ncbi:hypothetical protein D3C78_1563780 [compost metagenome]
MVRRGRRAASPADRHSLCHGPHSDLRMRLCEAVRAGREHTGQFPASGRLVYALAYHSRLPVLLVRLAALPQQTAFHAAVTCGSGGSGMGDP